MSCSPFFRGLILGIIALNLQSCCENYNSIVQKGYPYNNWEELNFSIYNYGCSSYGGTYNVDYILDSVTCQNMTQNHTWNCGCDNVDFDKHFLVSLRGIPHSIYLWDVKYQARAIINHKEKVLKVELRGAGQDCPGSPANRSHETYFNVLKVPKPPADYTIHVEYYDPVFKSN